jgi:NADH-quinone oxidoreductase subunit K
MIVPYTHVLLLAGILFLMGMVCAVTRRNLILVVLGLEIMLNASAVAFVGAGLHWGQTEGQAMALFILAVAGAEVAVGLALIVCIYRQTQTVDPECIEQNACKLD